MNDFEKGLLRYFKQEEMEKIRSVKIGIAGAGGLGSNCAFNLVRCGFDRLKIVDFDVIDNTNLNRQFYFINQIGEDKVEALRKNLIAINPGVILEISKLYIDKTNVKELFFNCDVVIEAFDNAIYKKMIVEEYGATEKLLVSASGLAGWGNSDRIKTHEINSRFFVIGDLKSEVTMDLPPVSPVVNIAAAKQADVVLNYVLKSGVSD